MESLSKAYTVEFNQKTHYLITLVTVFPRFDPDKVPVMQWPEGEKIYALWDTGASHSSISRSLAEKMKLPEMGNSNVLTSAGIQERTDYSINFYLHVPNLMFPALTVSAFNGVTAFDMIIGMDIINKGDFAVTHRYNNTVMSFNLPSVNHIDFEKKRY